MFQIAICDDEIEELDKAEYTLENYRKQHKTCDFCVQRFTDAEELLQKIQNKEYAPDLLFMDIYLPDRLGIDVVKELRGMGNGCRIIFATTSTEFALEAFRVNADQYFVKPIMEKELFPVLDKLFEKAGRDQKKCLSLQNGSRIYKVSLQDIVFCEAQKKSQNVYLVDGGQLQVRMTMTKIYDLLAGSPEFVKVGISYIINLEHVDSLNTRELQMDNGETIYLPRGSYHPLRESYFGYYCEEGL